MTKNARVQFSDPKSIELELEWSLVHTIIGKVKNISRPGLRSLKYYFGNVAYTPGPRIVRFGGLGISRTK